MTGSPLEERKNNEHVSRSGQPQPRSCGADQRGGHRGNS